MADNKNRPKKRTAVALEYDPVDSAPKVIASGTGTRRIQPSASFVHFPVSSMGCSSVTSYSPFSVSVTEQEIGVSAPRPLSLKSVQLGG